MYAQRPLSYAPTPYSYTPNPALAASINLDEEVKLASSSAERDLHESLAEIYSIIVTLDGLEKAYIRDVVTEAEYTETCTRLLKQYKSSLGDDTVAGEFVDLETFKRKWGLECPRATERLRIGLPATVEQATHSTPAANMAPAATGPPGGTSGSLILTATENFITFLDALKLNMVSKDALHPLLSEVIQSVNRVTDADFENRGKIIQWLITLNQMRATEELSEEQARELSFDIEQAYMGFKSDNELISPFSVLDLPQIHTKPSGTELIQALALLTTKPRSFGLKAPEAVKAQTVHPAGITRYLTSIISSPLAWLETDELREAVWDAAAARLSERSGRTAMPAMSRVFMIPTSQGEEYTLTLHEPSLTADNLGMKTWVSSYLLSIRLHALLESPPQLVPTTTTTPQLHPDRTLRALELGAGTGLVGLSFAALRGKSATIHLTDLPAIVPNLAHNAALNVELLSRTGATVTTGVLDWSMAPSPLPTPAEQYDLILAADPLYSPYHPKWLVDTVSHWLSRGLDARVVVEMPLRDAYLPQVQDFRQRMGELGLAVVDEGEEVGYDDWESADGGALPVRCCAAISLRHGIRSHGRDLTFCAMIFHSQPPTISPPMTYDECTHRHPGDKLWNQCSFPYYRSPSIMVIGLLVLSAIPTVTGVSLASSEQRKANERKNDERRMAKFYIDVAAPPHNPEDPEVHNKRVVLRDFKVFLDDRDPAKRDPPAHTAQAFYIEYPEFDHMKHLKRGFGVATSISDNPPMLGWIYADKDTHELKYGNRTQSCEHVIGPWDWVDDETTLTLEGSRQFVAVKEEDGSWGVYFDRDGDELEGVLEEQGKLDNEYLLLRLKRNLIEQPDDKNKNNNT
ncbi:S-adenosylmethionine-dependent methyltransferase [Aspergillus saccharolyticus JOP 1030-1]|uniref:VPS28-domain-containing protein n=1 Tax=Aspergillus saccharolyticus JOP 1030-1 TaxID=1450539 RepID=A0A318ZQP2_9EURO|nr:VPS28-domain-containing protein [Aspergillus saccharolyticus JOP 1030-1]PYH49377.1 VPS28-domain-containing protein [Aspergillus saccharolyticus JOP 1030-1]